jgi:hypothetical protein
MAGTLKLFHLPAQLIADVCNRPAYGNTPGLVDPDPLGREDDAMQDYDGDEPTGEIQALVNQDMTRILDYGEAHPDEYGGRWLNRDDRTYGVSFTSSLEQHEGALRTVLRLPERLRIQRCRRTYAELSALCERVRAEDLDLSDVDESGKPAISGFGPDQETGVVRVRVQRNRPDVSAQLSYKYGPLISIEEGDWVTVGL